MRKFINVLVSVCLMACVVFVSGCNKTGSGNNSQNTSAKTESDTLYVGTNAEFVPFEYLNKGEIVGFDIELINEIGKIIGKKIVMKNLAFDGLLPAMEAKKIDIIIAGMTANDERRKSVNFSDSYFTTKQAILIDKNTDNINSFDELKGHKVGVVLGYTADVIVTKKEGVEIQRYNATSEAIMALKSNKVDAVVLDSVPAKSYVKYNDTLKIIDTNLEEEEYSIAVPKDQEALLDKINKALIEIRSNGTYDKLLAKYFTN